MSPPNQSAELRFMVRNTLIVRDILRSVRFIATFSGPRRCVRANRPSFMRKTRGIFNVRSAR